MKDIINKKIGLFITLFIFLSCISFVSAVDNSTTSNIDMGSSVSTTTDISDSNSVTKELTDDSSNVKQKNIGSSVTNTSASNNKLNENNVIENNKSSVSSSSSNSSVSNSASVSSSSNTSNGSNSTISTKSATSLLSTVYVSKTGSNNNVGSQTNPKATLSGALSVVTNGGTIYIGAGTFKFSEVSVNKNVIIKGSGTSTTIIDANSKHFLTVNKGCTVTMYGLTIKNAKALSGAAIYNYGTLTLSKLEINDCKATKNGGAICNLGKLYCYYTYFGNNVAVSGGAILNYNYLYVKGCTFSEDVVTDHGGAIWNSKDFVCLNTLFKNNYAQDYGGAIYSTSNVKRDLSIQNCTFNYNRARVGGAISVNEYSRLYLKNSVVANSFGSAIVLNTKTVKNLALNCNFSYNTATQKDGSNKATSKGGAFNNINSILEIQQSIFYKNVAGKYGAAIYNNGGNTVVSYSIFKENDNVDTYNLKGTCNVNSNWWAYNTKPGSDRVHNVVLTKWIYMTVTSSSLKKDVQSTMAVSFNQCSNGNTMIATSSYIPSVSVSLTVSTKSGTQTYSGMTTNGKYSISKTISTTGLVTLTGYTYDTKKEFEYTIPSDTAYSTLFVQLYATVTSSTINTWVKAGITDVFVQVSESNKNNLNKIISLSKNTNIRVHAWLMCFYHDGSFDISTTRMNTVKSFIKTLINIEGVDGICLDYVRYSGTNPSIVSVSKITNFVKEVNAIVKSKSNSLLLSACVFPEKAGTPIYYGQDYAKLSPYVDIMLPMVYKYDYNANRAWIGSVIKYIVDRAVYSDVVGVIQTYGSSASTLLSKAEMDADIATIMANGGAGFSLFRYGLISAYPNPV
ncbi:MAG: hypothetical protein Q4Q23_00930 [Methanobacteriaceae archaeon]|nr:hypothetical protein [Methanobacteriaceae archaeon]